MLCYSILDVYDSNANRELLLVYQGCQPEVGGLLSQAPPLAEGIGDRRICCCVLPNHSDGTWHSFQERTRQEEQT